MSNMEVDDSSVKNLFKALEDDTRKRILFNALKLGGKKLAEETKVELRAKLGTGASTPSKWTGKPMESGIRIKALKDYCEVGVHIMGDFRLRFFEKGTKQRYTRKTKAYRGAIQGKHFFQTARAKESEITSVINNSIAESLKRIVK